MQVFVDFWDGELVEETEYINPTEMELIGYIESLDQSARTMITMIADNQSQLVIGGGVGKYICYFETIDNHLFSLVNSGQSSLKEEMLNIGGQEGNFNQDKIIEKSLAIEAANYFLSNFQRKSSLGWEEDGD